MEKKLITLCFIVVLAMAYKASSGEMFPDQPFPCTQANIFSDPEVLGGNMCTQFYGLCIAAPCEGLGQVELTDFEGDTFSIGAGLADEGDIIEHALCKCPFINGNSIGKAPCEDRKPDGDKSFSTYSFQFNNSENRILKCEQHRLGPRLKFADCYNHPCETDPQDPTMVICKCPVFPASIVPDNTFLTRGGDCNKFRCGELWSAVPPALLPFVDQAMACGIGNPFPAAKFACRGGFFR
jgi:hypothetical protein